MVCQHSVDSVAGGKFKSPSCAQIGRSVGITSLAVTRIHGVFGKISVAFYLIILCRAAGKVMAFPGKSFRIPGFFLLFKRNGKNQFPLCKVNQGFFNHIIDPQPVVTVGLRHSQTDRISFLVKCFKGKNHLFFIFCLCFHPSLAVQNFQTNKCHLRSSSFCCLFNTIHIVHCKKDAGNQHPSYSITD